MFSVPNFEQIEAIFDDCKLKKGEIVGNYLKVEGVITITLFNPDRLQKHTTEIKTIMDHLPDDFKNSSDNSWKFLNALNDQKSFQWTIYHQRAEKIYQLGVAIKEIEPISSISKVLGLKSNKLSPAV